MLGSGPARAQCKNLLPAYTSPEWPLASAHIVHGLTDSLNACWFKRHKQECQSIKKHLKHPLCAGQRASFKVTPQGILCRKRTGKQNKIPKLVLKKRMQSSPHAEWNDVLTSCSECWRTFGLHNVSNSYSGSLDELHTPQKSAGLPTDLGRQRLSPPLLGKYNCMDSRIVLK